VVRPSFANDDRMSFAVLCSGQGGQHAAALELVAGDPAAEDVLARATKVLGESAREAWSRPETWFDNRVAQPFICLTQLATWSALRDRVPTPAAFAGYSVGELASYGCAGALGAEELAKLADRRAALMDAALGQRGGLVAVHALQRGDVIALGTAHSVWIAIANADDAFVVGGENANLDAFAAAATAQGAGITRIPVAVPAHTPLLESAVAPFARALEYSLLQAPAVPVVAGIDASWVIDRSTAIGKLAKQLSATIEWAQCLDALWERGCRVFLELGPGAALAQMVRRRFGDDTDARSIDEFRSLQGVAAWVLRRA
jgi:[acyl-carrier-protein] S-malonyltransferase